MLAREPPWVMKSEAEKMSNYPSLKGREEQAKGGGGGQCSSGTRERAAKEKCAVDGRASANRSKWLPNCQNGHG